MVPVRPTNEQDRLVALAETGLLDTRPEDDFDSLAKLASVICDTPMAMVTLVDSQRQWFKARVGIESQETSRDIAFCAHTILQSELFVVKDASEDPRFSHNPLVTGDPNIRFYAGAPLLTDDGHRLGTLCVIDHQPRELTDQQCEALELLAEQANKQINLRRAQRSLEVTMARSSVIQQELRANQDLFHAFMDHSPFLASLKDSQGKIVYYNQQFADFFGITREAWLGCTHEELWPADIAAALREQDSHVLRKWKISAVEEHTERFQERSVDWKTYRFPFRDSEGREYVASLAVDITADKLARKQIEKYQQALEAANERLQGLAVTDSLTELPNRRAFEIALDREFALARRYDRPLALILLDIDNFKFFNDSFGHEEGDRILQRVGVKLSNGMRATDSIARYGGEEFAVIMPNTSRQSAMESAERLRIAIADDEQYQQREITVSLGVTTLESSKWTRDEFVRRADAALYKAKREGKNRACVC